MDLTDVYEMALQRSKWACVFALAYDALISRAAKKIAVPRSLEAVSSMYYHL